MGTYLIGEVGLGHDGSLGAAIKYIDFVADAGGNAVKFQAHFAEHESSDDERFRVNVFFQDATRQAYWDRTSFSAEEWSLLMARAKERGIDFLCTPFSPVAFEMLKSLGLRKWKVGSGDLLNFELLSLIRDSGHEVILSTGMANWDEIHRAVAFFSEHQAPVTVMQCTTGYPTEPEDIGLNVLDMLRERFPSIQIGLSDHSGTIYPGLAAGAYNIDMVEVHVTFSKRSFGPDVPASLEFDEFKMLADGLEFLARCHSSPVDKNIMAHQKTNLKSMFGRSLYFRKEMKKGEIVGSHDLIYLKPSGGLLYEEREQLLGKALARDVSARTRVEYGHFVDD